MIFRFDNHFWNFLTFFGLLIISSTISITQDLKQELPEATGLTRTNLYYCKKFYLLYNQANIIVPQVEGKLQDEKLPQLGAEIQTLVSAVPKARIERYYNDHGTICVF